MLGEVLARLLPQLDERQRRLTLGAAARVLGYGGVRRVARLAGVAESTVARGARELDADQEPADRVRTAGGGRKPLRESDPGLVMALLALVEPDQRGDPESPLRWTVKSTRNLAAELTRQGHQVGPDTVAALLKAEGFSLQGTSRTTEGARHPDRDAQFHYINDRVKEFTAAGQPVISVDTKKKEVLGSYAVAGQEWHRSGQPVQVRAHDFPEKDAQKAVPYGIYDLAADAGWVSVGCDGDTAAFAVATLRRWWDGEGRHRYPGATRLLITADAGGSNGYRVRAWKKGLADFAHAAGLEVAVCHFPPGTSKWNKIEHRLFSRISSNWRGRPLTSHEVVVNTIGATTTRTGLTVHAELDPGAYPTGVTVPDEVMAALPLTAHDWHGTWNYTLRPEPPTPTPVPTSEDRTQPDDRAPDWLHHPTLTGMDTAAFADLLAEVEQYLLDHPPISLHHKRARHRTLRRGPLSLSDRLLVTVIRHRWKTQIRVLTSLLGSPAAAVGDALHEMTPVLEAIDRRVRPAPITAPTTADLANLVGRTHTKNAK
ncbi:ISAzo13 family transposase [Kitasatospora sp. NBC_00070]|uniref:ISAzo13 family transposase n=1 Tax=Kitasatospora sp. NBC_00070 TaxID=2975962 RepID=UPI0038602A73